MSLSVIYSRYASQISNLQSAAANVANSNTGIVQRQWRIPDGWITQPLDIPNLDIPFLRTDMNTAFPSFFNSDSGKVADCMATQMQSDHLAMQRRSFGLRHATRVRCMMHSAGRRAGHGNANGGLFARLTNHLQDIIMSGGV